MPAVARMRPDDLFLACACAQRDSRAITEFDRHLLAPAMATLVRMGEQPALVDEAAQAIRERLFLVERRICEFVDACRDGFVSPKVPAGSEPG